MPVPTLWHANLKINTDERGFNFKFHLSTDSETEAKSKATSIALRYRAIMPQSAEIFYATISKDDSKRDSRLLPAAIGAGTFESEDEEIEVSEYDFSRTSLLIRMEHSGGGAVPRKICPLPDEFVYASQLTGAVVAVTEVPDVIPAIGAEGLDWFDEMTNLMADLVKNTVHVEYGHAPGGDYQPRAWTAAYPIRISQKKGGRVSI